MPHSFPSNLLSELDQLEALRQSRDATQSQRQFERFVIRGEAELHPMSRTRLDRTPVDVKLRDVSLGGAGFVTSEPLEVGSSWQIIFHQRGYPIADMTLMVRHCRKISDGVYLCGSQFIAGGGLLSLLGVDRAVIEKQFSSNGSDSSGVFVPPSPDYSPVLFVVVALT